MNRRVRIGRIGLALATLWVGFAPGCSHEDRGERPPSSPAVALRVARRAAEARDEATLKSEEREEVEDRALRRRGEESLAKFRAASCADAIGTIEALLRRGDGRWAERTAAGGLPVDLTGWLTQAELWASQSEGMCHEEAERSRLQALQEVMRDIWRYPKTISKDDLESRLAVLGRADGIP